MDNYNNNMMNNQQFNNQQFNNQQPVYVNPNLEQPCSVGDWMITMFLSFIPFVGFIMLLVWAFGGGCPKSKANWAKASLLWMVIGIIFSIIFYTVMGAALLGIAHNVR